jgi:hypothetical protein
MVRGGGSRRKPERRYRTARGRGRCRHGYHRCLRVPVHDDLTGRGARSSCGTVSGTPPPWRHPGYLEALAGRFMLVLVDGRGRSGKPHDPPCTPPSAGRRRSLLPEVFDAVQELIRPDLELDRVPDLELDRVAVA